MTDRSPDYARGEGMAPSFHFPPDCTSPRSGCGAHIQEGSIFQLLPELSSTHPTFISKRNVDAHERCQSIFTGGYKLTPLLLLPSVRRRGSTPKVAGGQFQLCESLSKKRQVAKRRKRK